MSTYSQGIAADGPVILRDGKPMTPEQIVEELNRMQDELDRAWIATESTSVRSLTTLSGVVATMRSGLKVLLAKPPVAWIRRDGSSGIVASEFFEPAVKAGRFDRKDFRPLVFGGDVEYAGMVVMPRRLTAEDGAKAALIGEFTVTVAVDSKIGHCIHAPIPWTTIKGIYEAAVRHFNPGA